MKQSALQFIKVLLLIAIALPTLNGCIDEDEYDNTPQGNIEALWKIMDEHYCFFTDKGINWDSIHAVYSKQANNSMTNEQMFEVMANMLSELKDGHVNLYAAFNVARNWSWHENYPSNYSDTLENKYLGTDYRIASGLRYRILDDNIGFVRCATFENEFGAGNLDEIMMYLASCNGLIIDIRDNSGGLITAAQQLAARFTNKKLLVGYSRHKTGRGHDDFSDFEAEYLEPSKGIRWQKRVIVLTNRSVFSAANEFVKNMKCCANVTLVGDQTGGGAGLPMSSELPCGWSVRYSACPIYDAYKQITEFGIEPDYNVSLTDDDFLKGEDTIIEFARKLLR